MQWRFSICVCLVASYVQLVRKTTMQTIQRLGSSSSTQTSDNRARGVWQPIVVIGLGVILATRLFLQVSHYAVNIFFSDQWDFLDATLFEKHTAWQMFRWQHGPPRLGLGTLLSKLLEPHFLWNSRGEAFVATAIVTAAAVCALFLKARVWGPLKVADIAIPILFFTPAQFEGLWVTPDFAHGPLPLLLIVLYCLALTCRRAGARYAIVLTINFVAIYTGFGLFIGFVTPIWLILEYYSKRTLGEAANSVLIPLAVSLVSLGSFFVGYKSEPAAGCFSPLPARPLTDVTFFLGMLAHNFGARGPQIISIPLGTGVLIFSISVLVSFAKHFKESKGLPGIELIPAVLVTFALLFSAATAYGRSCEGSHLAFVSRYTTYLALGILGLFLFSIGGRQQSPRTIWLGCLLVLLVIGALPTHPSDQRDMQVYHETKSTWRNCYLATEDIQRCDREAGFSVYGPPEQTHLKEKLQYLKQAKLNLYAPSP
jgi:hypothetical protein